MTSTPATGTRPAATSDRAASADNRPFGSADSGPFGSADSGPFGSADSGPQLPDRAAFWRWVYDAVRPLLGWLLVVLGAVSLLLGWIGVSGESLTSKQLPYLVSGGFAGIGLIVVAAVFLATDDFRRQMRRLDEVERKVGDLYSLLVDSGASAVNSSADAAPAAAGRGKLMALPGGSSYHRPDCALVTGKSAAAAVDAAEIRSRKLSPCRVCAPDPPA